MENFIDAIKEGIKNAENYNLNKSEMLSVFEEANAAFFEKTGRENGLIALTENGGFHCTGFIESCSLSKKSGYPVILATRIGDFESRDKNELIENISKIMSSAAFGFYVKHYIRD